MSTYYPIAYTDEATVVSEYTPEYRTATHYQSEAELEREFIGLLSEQSYEFLTFAFEAELNCGHLRPTRHTDNRHINRITCRNRSTPKAI